MFILNKDMSVEMCQGDVGSVCFHLDNFTLENEDKCKFVVYTKSGVVLEKDIEQLNHGIGYFVFNSEDTKKLAFGDYYYDIICNIVGVGLVTTHSQIKFTIKKGWYNVI